MSDDKWEDQPIPEDEAIKAAHPTRSGQHETYQEAMRLVGAKRSKGALVELVNWLLVEARAGWKTANALSVAGNYHASERASREALARLGEKL